MEIILVRHALPERVENSDGTLADPPLAPTGYEQAERLAEWLSMEPITHIAASPRKRARETAAPLAKRLGIEPEIIEEFSEIDRSSRLYIPIEEMRNENHPQYQKLMNREWDAAGFMDPKLFQQEVIKGYTRLIGQWDEGETVVVVAHGGTLNAIASHIMKLPDIFFYEPYYTSITRLKASFGGGKKNLRLWVLNETAHLYSRRESLDPLA